MKYLLTLLLLVPLASMAANEHAGSAAKKKVPSIQSGEQAAGAAEHAGTAAKQKVQENGGEAMKSKAKEAAEHGGQPVKKKVDEHAGKAVQQ